MSEVIKITSYRLRETEVANMDLAFDKVDMTLLSKHLVVDFCKQQGFKESTFWIAMCFIVKIHLYGSYDGSLQLKSESHDQDVCHSILEMSFTGEPFSIPAMAASIERVVNEPDFGCELESPLKEAINDVCITLELDIRESHENIEHKLPIISVRSSKSDEEICERRLYTHIFNEVLRQILKMPDRDVLEFQSTTQEELSQMKDWANYMIPDGPSCLHELVQPHFETSANEIAVQAHDGAFSYEELDQHSARLGNFIASLSIDSPARIILCLRKSKWLVVGWLGILRSGNTCVPLDSTVSDKRVQHIVKDTRSQFALVDSVTKPTLEKVVKETFQIEHISSMDLDNCVDRTVSHRTAAAIIFTSGSTGTPKGVIQSHCAIAKGVQVVAGKMELQRCTRFLQFSSLSFDVSVCEIFPTLSVGGCICIPSQDGLVRDISTTIDTMGVTDVCLTSSVIQCLDSKTPKSLRCIFTGGERVGEDTLKAWATATSLRIVYGTTETGVWDTMTPNLGHASSPSNIGLPIGCSAWVVNRSNPNLLSPLGVIGELYIFGPCVADGYLNDEKKTQSAFESRLSWIKTVLDGHEGRGFRTGDLAVRNQDGSITLLGRSDNQIKIRGQRVEPVEVESVIHKALPPKAVAVVEKIMCLGDERLVCFLSHQDEQWHDLSGTNALNDIESSARKLVSEELTQYMAPSRYVFLNTLPRTSSQKINRAELRSFKFSEETRDSNDQEDSTAVPDNLHDEVKQIIGDTVVNTHVHSNGDVKSDDYSLAKLGLDSIQLAMLSRAFQQQFNVAVPMSVLMDENASLRSLVKYVQANTGMINDSGRLLENAVQKWQTKYRSLRKRNVFVTGGNGFLGIHIIGKLLEDPSIGNITVLIRAESCDTAKNKLKSAAQVAQLWTEENASRIEVWLGDLARPKLGLEDNQWNTMLGGAPEKPAIDMIIHNGAIVNWSADLQSLEKANVESTFQILSGLSHSSNPPKFIFISGGALTSSTKHATAQIESMCNSCGYDQSKLCSELLVDEYNTEKLRQNNPQALAHVVRPGFIIGTAKEGVCHRSDYIWRLTRVVVKLGFFSAEEGDTWLQVAGADLVADSIVQSSGQEPLNGEKILTLLDGLPLRSFYAQLSEIGLPVSAIRHERWIEMLRSDMEEYKERHPLYPLADWVEQTEGRLGISEPSLGQLTMSQESIRAAVCQSMKFLKGIGFLSKDGGYQLEESPETFSRSKF